jgi:hypothetical protein
MATFTIPDVHLFANGHSEGLNTCVTVEVYTEEINMFEFNTMKQQQYISMECSSMAGLSIVDQIGTGGELL